MAAGAEIEVEVRTDPAHHITFDLNGTGARMLGFSVILYGWSLRNPSSSTAAVMDIYDADYATGEVVFPLTLATSESVGDWYGPNGIWMKNAVYVNVTAGEVKGSLFYRHHRGA